MYELIFNVPDVYHTAMRPVARTVLRSLLKNLGISHMFGDRISFESFAETNTASASEHRKPTLMENNIVLNVSYSTKADELPWPVSGANIDFEQLSGTAGLANQLNKVMLDSDYGLSIGEYNKPCALSIDCTFGFVEVVNAMEVLQKLNMHLSNGVGVMDLDFSYYLPPNVYEMLYRLYLNIDPTGIGFKQWMYDKSGGLIGYNLNRDDHADTAISVRKTYADALYGIDVQSSEPEPVGQSKSPDLYTLKVNIGCQFSLPNSLALIYPIVVNNALVGEPFITPYKLGLEHSELDNIFCNLNAFRKARLSNFPTMHIKRYPHYDNWMPHRLGNFTPFMIGLLTLDDIENEEGVTTINIEQDYGELIEPVIAEIKDLGLKALSQNGIINISTFANDTMISPSSLTYDPITTDLTFSERDIKKAYRVVLSVDYGAFSRKHSLMALNITLLQQKI